ncbi:helix-turn-helix transcriptional regulator [Streptomyces sp. NPDC048242]|uniref:helix-turn-helix domain-containing protein n=1 Tax=Streptomyces sp. NPDC048242 TaxID=3155026 RepID=UPI00343C15C9
MADSSKLRIGARVKHFRLKSGRSQVVIAGLCDISERHLSLIENGKRNPSHELLLRLAAELGVSVGKLLDGEQPEEGPEENKASLTTAADIARSLMGYGTTRSDRVPTPAVLRERVEQAWATWQTSEQRFTDIEQVLPALIADMEQAMRGQRSSTDAVARREVFRAAEDADDPIRIAAANWNLGHCLLSQDGGAEEAGEIAQAAIRELRDVPDSDEKAAVQGALELVQVVADAQARKWWEARARLTQKAAPLGARVGDTANVQWTVFGPTNVHLHRLSIEMLAGETSEGLRLADEVDVSVLPSRERQFTFTLDLARCYDLQRDDAAVIVHLLDMEKLSEEDMMRSPLARDMVSGLLRRVRPTYRRQVAKLAERTGVI